MTPEYILLLAPVLRYSGGRGEWGGGAGGEG